MRLYRIDICPQHAFTAHSVYRAGFPYPTTQCLQGASQRPRRGAEHRDRSEWACRQSRSA